LHAQEDTRNQSLESARDIPRLLQECDQRTELRRPEVTQLPSVQGADGRLERPQDPEAIIRDARCDHAAILPASRSFCQAAILQPVQEPRDVRISSNHPLADFPAG
jgi:hypothetical protein